MNFKKTLRVASFVLFIALTLPARSAIIVPGPAPTNSPAKTENPRAGQLLQRLEDIRAMDKSELTGSEKRDLRKEVKGIRKEMKTVGNGVYLSVGAIIIIILLLILIL